MLARAPGSRWRTPSRAPGCSCSARSSSVGAPALRSSRRARLPACALALALAGWWWSAPRGSSARPQRARAGASADRRAVTRGRDRTRAEDARSRCASPRGAPIRTARVRERVLLELPVGRSPPQGAVLAFRAQVDAPRGPKDGFDERGWLARRGVHVVAPRRRLADRRPPRRASAASPTGSARMSRARSPPGSTGSAARVARGDRARRGRGARPTSSGTASRPRASTTCWRCRGRTSRSWRSACWARVAARHPAARGRGRRDRGDRRLRARGRLAALGRPRRRRGRARVARVAGCRGRATAGTSSRSARPSCSRGHPHACSSRASSSRSQPSASIFLLLPRLAARLEGYPMTAWLARRARGLDRVRGGHRADPLAPVRQPCRSTRCSANVLVPLAIAPLLGLALVGSLLEPLLPGRRRCARVGERLARRLHRRVRAARRRAAATPRSPPGGPSRPARDSARAPRSARLPRWRRAGGARLRGDGRAGAARLAALPEPRLPPPPGLRITFLDVGQGDAILLQVPGGRDARRPGPARGGRRAAAARARASGASRARADPPAARPHRRRRDRHPAARRRPRARPAPRRVEPVRGAALAAAAERGVPVVEARAGRRLPARPAADRASSGRTGPGSPAEDPNRLPVVLLATYGELDVLLTADAETEVTARLALAAGRDAEGRASRLRGSRPRASCASCGPAIAVISCGRGNDYGHPTPSTLAALERSPGLEPLPDGRGRARHGRVGRARSRSGRTAE